jgi:snurportin-1
MASFMSSMSSSGKGRTSRIVKRLSGQRRFIPLCSWFKAHLPDEHEHRFWWRDTRLSELLLSRPPKMFAPHIALQASTQEGNSPIEYRFPYPTTFLQIPYYTYPTFAHSLDTIIPRARSIFHAQVPIPAGPNDTDVMDIESSQFMGPAPRTAQAEIKPDGLLLYVAQTIYEPGTSPLSSWVPLAAPATDEMASVEQPSPLDVFER